MTWNYDISYERIKNHLDSLGEIEIKPMVREMDLDNLSETVCRDINGAHIYAEIRNLSALVGEMTTDRDRRLIIQAVHCWQREVARIAKAVGARLIHFQGGRAHLLVYRPINDDETIATKAALLQLIVDRYGTIFSEEFSALSDLLVRSGSDRGHAIGTRNGSRGDRELLFLGNPANVPAKLLNDGADRRLTAAVRNVLTDDIAAYVEPDPAGESRLLRPSDAQLEELLNEHDIDWSAEAAADRLAADRDAFPIEDVGLSGATVKIDFDDLSFYNSKLVNAATVYADVSGFTAHIDAAETDDEKREALREFHAIRREMATVTRSDFNGVRVQFQGDRVQGLFHMPADDAGGISTEAVSTAIGLQSSFEHPLKDLLPGIAELGLAVGISRGDTIATRLGERGHLDRICLGREVLRAEHNEERVGKFEIGISANVRDRLGPDLAEHFVWSADAGCYVASGLDQAKLDLDEASKGYASDKPAYVRPTPAGPVIDVRPSPGARPVRPARSYGR